jgi:hypothetical protein
MAHYAYLNDDNIVVNVITGIDETELIEGLDPETWYGNFTNQKCVRTSYNAATNGFRFNYAGIGYTYDPIDDAFVPPMPGCGHESLTLNDLKRWECADCDEIAKRMASIEEQG